MHLSAVPTTPRRELILELSVPGEPCPKERARTGKGRVYTPSKTLNAERTLQLLFLSAGIRTPIDSPMVVDVDFFMGNKRRVDLSNLVKLLEDAANGVVWVDDSQVIGLFATKLVDKERPRTELRVWKVN